MNPHRNPPDARTVILNEVKDLLYLSYSLEADKSRFFVAVLLKMTPTRSPGQENYAALFPSLQFSYKTRSTQRIKAERVALSVIAAKSVT